MPPDASLSCVLYVDLTDKSYHTVQRPELFEKYLGGTGVAAALLEEECPEGADPFSPENPVILAVGPLTGLFPLASKTVAMFKSPLTGNLGESHCGGRSAISIRMAGYGAIVIRGKSDIPVYLSISGSGVDFRNASTLWGMQSSFTVGRIIRENESGAGLRTIMRIGGAGENLVKYACVTTETYRHFGRMGLGAVFGSKKLKAVVVSGKRSIGSAGGNEYNSLYNELYSASTASTVMKKYHDLGTAENVHPLNLVGGLPTRNLQQARFEDAETLSGESLAANYLGRRIACSHCPVGCIHIAALREPYKDEAYFYKTSMISYDYELIFALGSMLGIGDAAGFLKLTEQVEKYAMDAISAGVVMAWATEAREKGIITDTETLGIPFEWGNSQAYADAVSLIVEQPNRFYEVLAQGVDAAAREYGGADYALAFGGNEMAGYHTGPAAYLGFMAGMRHSHLDNAGYSIDQKVLLRGSTTPEELAQSLVREETWRQVLSSLVVCFFARGIYEPGVVSRCLKIAGFDCPEEDLYRIGKEIYLNKFRFKEREGFSFQKLRIPERILQTKAPAAIDRKFMVETLKKLEEIIRS